MNTFLKFSLLLLGFGCGILFNALMYKPEPATIQPTGDPVNITCATEGIEWLNCN